MVGLLGAYNLDLNNLNLNTVRLFVRTVFNEWCLNLVNVMKWSQGKLFISFLLLPLSHARLQSARAESCCKSKHMLPPMTKVVSLDELAKSWDGLLDLTQHICYVSVMFYKLDGCAYVSVQSRFLKFHFPILKREDSFLSFLLVGGWISMGRCGISR